MCGGWGLGGLNKEGEETKQACNFKIVPIVSLILQGALENKFSLYIKAKSCALYSPLQWRSEHKAPSTFLSFYKRLSSILGQNLTLDTSCWPKYYFHIIESYIVRKYLKYLNVFRFLVQVAD